MSKDKKVKSEIVKEIDSDSDYVSDNSVELNESVEDKIELDVEQPVKKIKAKRIRDKIIKTDVGEVLVKRGRKKKKEPIVVYLSSSESEEQEVIVKRKRGRPKSSKNKCSIKYLDDNGVEQSSRNKSKRTIIEHTDPDRKLTAKEVKLLDLEQKLAEMEAVTGKKLLSTKKGKVDQRTLKKPTEKQLAARAKFVQDNAARRMKKKLEKENDKIKLAKDSVKVVVEELVETKKANNIKKAEILKELKEETVKVKPVQPANDDLFN